MTQRGTRGESPFVLSAKLFKLALEMELQSEFHIARRIERAGNLPERRRSQRPATIRSVEIRRVGKVEELRPEIEILVFREVELLANRRIPIEEAWAVQDADARAAERP